MLLNRNANPNARDGSGKTALHYAFSGSSVALLLRRGADLNLADNFGSLELVEALLNKGASASLSAPPLGTPFHMLSLVPERRSEHFSTIATLLVRKGADVNAINDTGRPPLMLAPHQCNRSEEDLRILMDLGAKPNTVDPTGATLLHYALQDETYRNDVVRQLLAVGANPAAYDRCGRGVLYLASMRVSHNLSTFEALLDALPAAERGSHLAAALPAALKAKAEAIFDIIMKEEGSTSTCRTAPVGRPWISRTATECHVRWRYLRKRVRPEGRPKRSQLAFPCLIGIAISPCWTMDCGLA
jgi:ankyrin repeat protein